MLDLGSGGVFGAGKGCDFFGPLLGDEKLVRVHCHFSGLVISNLASAGRTDRLSQMQVECSTWDAERRCEGTQDS